MQHYSNPKREREPHTLPDVETFYMSQADIDQARIDNGGHDDDTPYTEPGYYYWFCLPGCMPDGDPVGPFKTEAEALADMRDNNDEEED